MKSYLLTAIFVVNASLSATAQLAFKTSLLTPRGDIGQTFEKCIAYDLFLSADWNKDRMRSRLGIMHATLQPRLDTFPVYIIKGEHTLLPGSASFSPLRMNLFYLDHDFRLYHYKGLSVYAGVGLTFGWARYSYHRNIETVIIEDGEINDIAGGIRGHAQISYDINEHFMFFAEAMHSAISETKWTRSYAHETYGIGIRYTIKRMNDE